MRTSARTQQYLALSVLCVLAWGISLLNYDGIYWDDWTLLGNTDANLKSIFDESGIVFARIAHSLLGDVGNGVWIYRWVSFGSSWITGLIIFKLLLRLPQVSPSDAFYVAALSIVYPVNQARVAIVNTPYAYSLAIFFVAFALLTWSLRTKRLETRVLSLGLFFLSFEVGSLLAFYLVPVSYVLFQERAEWGGEVRRGDGRRVWRWAFRRLDVLCLPLVFVALKALYFSASGEYDGYNAVTLGGLWYGAWMSFWAMYQASVAAINAAAADVSSVIVPVVAALAYFLSRVVATERDMDRDRRFYLGMLVVGVLLLYLAVFPYAAVHKIGRSLDWHSRHQLLTPLGGSVCLYALLRILMRRARPVYMALAMSTVLLTFAHKDFKDMARYQVDWAKQESIIQQLKGLEAVRENPGKRFLIVDNAPKDNAAQRTYRFYELSGFFRAAFDDNTRLAVSTTSMPAVEGPHEHLLRNNILARGTEPFAGRVTIQSVDRVTDPAPGLYFFRLFDRDEYRRRYLRLVTLEYRSCRSGNDPGPEPPPECLP